MFFEHVLNEIVDFSTDFDPADPCSMKTAPVGVKNFMSENLMNQFRVVEP